MSIIFDNTSVLAGASPWTMAGFEVSDKPKLIFAYGLGADDVICVRRVVSSDNPNSGFKSNGCSTTAPQAGFVLARQDVMSCGIRVCMCANQNSVVISEPGDYELVGTGSGIAGGSIYIEATEWLSESSPPANCFDCFNVPCEDTTWTATGNERCVGSDVEREETSNCGTTRWVTDRQVVWTPTGQKHCEGETTKLEERNDCGATRWVAGPATKWTDTGSTRCTAAGRVEKEQINECCCGTKWVDVSAQTWTDTGVVRCTTTNVEKEQKNECGTTRWVTDRPQVWTETGESRCKNFRVEVQETNDCGATRWTATTTVCGYCPSLRVSCDSNSGYGYHVNDPKDPAATVEMAPCTGDTSVDSVWIYPSSGPGHTIKVTDCDGNLIGYAANRSDCAADCGC